MRVFLSFSMKVTGEENRYQRNATTIIDYHRILTLMTSVLVVWTVVENAASNGEHTLDRGRHDSKLGLEGRLCVLLVRLLQYLSS